MGGNVYIDDLPDFISPTPGICLTNQVSKILSSVADYFGQQGLSKALFDDIHESSIMAQCFFFVFNLL